MDRLIGAPEALEYVHANGVVHRDIKPSNVMLVTYGTTTFRARARLTDFGIAGGILASDRTEAEGKTTTGTAAYLSPEQASLNGLDVDTRRAEGEAGRPCMKLTNPSRPPPRTVSSRAGRCRPRRPPGAPRR